jgi:catechol 2,3-dioxygenase-like lactoylglutathione lyase family enzyme
MEKDALRQVLHLGRIAQVGFVVRDLSQSIKNYQEIIGIGPFTTLELRPEKSFIKDRKPDFHLKIGFAQLTEELALELVEVVGGEPYHKDFLEKHGEGVQHLGFVTDEYDQVLKRADKLGIEVLMWGEADVPGAGHIRAAYLDTSNLMGVVVEVIEMG